MGFEIILYKAEARGFETYRICESLAYKILSGRSRARTVDGQAGLDRFATSKIHKSTGLVLIKSDKSDTFYRFM